MHFREWKVFLIKISLKFVPEGQINNKQALVYMMAWCQIDDKPLSNQCWSDSLTHIYVALGGDEFRGSLLSTSILAASVQTCLHLSIDFLRFGLTLITQPVNTSNDIQTATDGTAIPIPYHHCQDTVNHLKIGYPYISSTGTQSSNELHW